MFGRTTHHTLHPQQPPTLKSHQRRKFMLGHVAVALLPVLRRRHELRPLVPKGGGGVKLDESHGRRPSPIACTIPVPLLVTAFSVTTPITWRTQTIKQQACTHVSTHKVVAGERHGSWTGRGSRPTDHKTRMRVFRVVC